MILRINTVVRERKSGCRMPKRIPCSHGIRAFSLVEVLCAVLILAVGVVGLSQGVVMALGSSKESEIQSKAMMIASGRIEFLRADGYLVSGESDGECGALLEGHLWRQSIKTTDLEGLYEIKVSIEQSESGKVVNELVTLMFDPPITSTNETSSGTQGSRDSNRNRQRQRRGQ